MLVTRWRPSRIFACIATRGRSVLTTQGDSITIFLFIAENLRNIAATLDVKNLKIYNSKKKQLIK